MKGSKIKDIDKITVAGLKVNNPDMKLREISEETGLPISTVGDIVSDIPEIAKSSEKLGNLFDRNIEIQDIVDERIKRMIINDEESIKLSELTGLRESTFKQNTILGLGKGDKGDTTIILQI